jgi:hypothetical protein
LSSVHQWVGTSFHPSSLFWLLVCLGSISRREESFLPELAD